MRGIQRKLVLALAGLVFAVVAISGVLAEHGIRRGAIENLERSLLRRAELVSQLTGELPFQPERSRELDAIADAAAPAAGARVTLIDREGRVLGDSDVVHGSLAGIENHADRPEVQAALLGSAGTSTRRSDTVKRHLLYLAIPAAGPSGGGVVRLAVDIAEVESAFGSLRNVLVLAAVIGLLASLGLSSLLARRFLRPVEELHDVVVEIADGKLDQRLHWWSADELGEIGLAINRVAEQLRQRLDDATREKEQLEAVLGSMVEGVLVIDTAGRVSLANPRLRELLDIWGPIVGRPWFELIRDAEAESALREAMAQRELVACEISGRAGDERVLQLHAVGFPARGPRLGTVVALHDVTEMRRLDNVRRDFIANASHELKTPLTAIRGFADTLMGNDLSDEEVERYISVISRNAERMSNLVEDLLTLSRIEGRSTLLEIDDIDTEDVIHVMLDDLRQRLEAKDIEAVMQPGGVARARADRRALEQILTNLLDNALKYTDPGGRIEVGVEETNGHLRIRVEDTGRGIPEEDCSRIFERFYRVDAARSRALGGTGLGLAIVKHLVHSMGGEIYVESEVGRGSRFLFTLPRSTKSD